MKRGAKTKFRDDKFLKNGGQNLDSASTFAQTSPP